MTKNRRWLFAVLVLAGAALAVMPTSRAEAALVGCAAIGGVGSPCTVSGPASFTITATDCPITINDNVLLTAAAKIVVPGSTSCVINVTGNFTMDPGTVIDGSSAANPGRGADITVNATGNITLTGSVPGTPGAIIQSNHLPAGSCTGASRGGNIALNADSDNDFDGFVEQGAGSKIDSIAACGLGAITITGKDINLDGEVRTEGTRSTGRGGPITVNAKCKLNVSDTGEIISLGHDPGADLVHLQGGCDVKVFGLVASTGPGHNRPTTNRCDSNNPGAPIRPGKPNNSNACVEIWSGGPMLIDSAAPHNGEVNADTGQSGGPEGLGWVELFAVGDITITGDSTAAGTACTPIKFTGGGALPIPTYAPCFAVHANQGAPGPGGISNGHGGLINVFSTTGSVIASGRAIQANDTANGGSGGRPQATAFCAAANMPCGGINIQGDQNVDLTNAKIEAKGAANGHGGQVDVRAFNLAILANNVTSINVTGGTPPDGVVHLTQCTAVPGPGVPFPPGVVTPLAALTPAGGTTGVCGGGPVLPAYVDTQPFPGLGPFPTTVEGGTIKGCPLKCGGECQCVSTFKLNPGGTILTLKPGFNLKSVTEVRLSTASCDTTTSAIVPAFVKKANGEIDVTVPGGLVTGDYHIITESAFNVCCTLDTVHIP